jgi:hypothetical protein
MSDEQPDGTPQEEPQQDLAAVRAEVAELHKRMEELRATTEQEVLKNWQSPWRGADAVKAKVDARLASNPEFRQVMGRARDAQLKEAQLDPDHVDQTAGAAHTGHPAIGR